MLTMSPHCELWLLRLVCLVAAGPSPSWIAPAPSDCSLGVSELEVNLWTAPITRQFCPSGLLPQLAEEPTDQLL